jgi:hypothetical protein
MSARQAGCQLQLHTIQPPLLRSMSLLSQSWHHHLLDGLCRKNSQWSMLTPTDIAFGSIALDQWSTFATRTLRLHQCINNLHTSRCHRHQLDPRLGICTTRCHHRRCISHRMKHRRNSFLHLGPTAFAQMAKKRNQSPTHQDKPALPQCSMFATMPLLQRAP